MSGHTPGPWRYWGCTVDSVTGMRDYLQFAAGNNFVFRAPIRYITEADARLIAAAPDLLEALQMIYSETADYIRLNNLGGMDNQCMQLSCAAIAKATGKQPAGEGEK